jgi:hypothetical protein
MGELKNLRDLSIQAEGFPDSVEARLTILQRMVWSVIALFQLRDLTRFWVRRARHDD